jgi:integrase
LQRPSPEQVERLAGALRCQPEAITHGVVSVEVPPGDEYRLLFAFAAATGTRLGEVLGLRWHGLDLDAGTAYISHQLGRKGDRSPLKTQRSRRTMELPPSLVLDLRVHKLATPYSGDHDFVFANRQGRGHDHRNIGGRVLGRAVKRAGLESTVKDGVVVSPAPTFHSLRHSHGSALVASGWDIEEVSEARAPRQRNHAPCLHPRVRKRAKEQSASRSTRGHVRQHADDLSDS